MNKLKNNSKPLIWCMGLLLTAFVAGCGSGGDGGGTTAQPGTVSVSMTDGPACGFDEVNVTVSKVRVHRSGSADENTTGWTDIVLSSPRKINLLNLNDPTQTNGALDYLGETSLAAGHYTQLRLVLVPNSGGPAFANSVVLSGSPGEIALDTPSAVQSGIKLIHQFTVGSGQRVDLLLDFDACHSIVQTGNGKYKLKPVIKVIPFVLNGIEGFVDPALFTNQPNVNNNVNNVVVSAQRDGEIVRATVPNSNSTPNPNRGKFFLTHLSSGVTYDVVITADGHATKVISGVPVLSSTSITTVSTASMPAPPITLQTSTSQSINGTVTLNQGTDEETVFVSGKQTFGIGPTVTVKSKTANLLTGNPTGDYEYALTLPIGAPSLAPYATPLPVVFVQQPLVADKYTIQASATGYVTQSAPDISTGATQDFTLNLVP